MEGLLQSGHYFMLMRDLIHLPRTAGSDNTSKPKLTVSHPKRNGNANPGSEDSVSRGQGAGNLTISPPKAVRSSQRSPRLLFHERESFLLVPRGVTPVATSTQQAVQTPCRRKQCIVSKRLRISPDNLGVVLQSELFPMSFLEMINFSADNECLSCELELGGEGRMAGTIYNYLTLY
eukprot:9026950-Pyramimonas_sp.AAC.1